jgi:Fe2+ transport system protein FeoA
MLARLAAAASWLNHRIRRRTRCRLATPAQRQAGVSPPAAREAAGRSLARLAPGTSARVARLTGEPALRRRLLEMGLVPGAEVTLLRRAPFGDPIELRAHGYLLSVRTTEAMHVETEDVR